MYVRTSMKFGGNREICPGLEFRPLSGDSFGELSAWLEKAADTAVKRTARADNPREIAENLQGYIVQTYPDRAYFIEVGDMDRWVQIYQPWEPR